MERKSRCFNDQVLPGVKDLPGYSFKKKILKSKTGGKTRHILKITNRLGATQLRISRRQQEASGQKHPQKGLSSDIYEAQNMLVLTLGAVWSLKYFHLLSLPSAGLCCKASERQCFIELALKEPGVQNCNRIQTPC